MDIDIQDLIANSYNYDRIEHVECTRSEAEDALADLRRDDGYDDDCDTGEVIDVWGTCHTQHGEGTWRIQFDIA